MGCFDKLIKALLYTVVKIIGIPVFLEEIEAVYYSSNTQSTI